MNLRALALLAALAAAGSGCIANDSSVRLYGLCAPPTPTAGGLCVYTPACAALELGRLQADVDSEAVNGPLIWPLQVNNARPSNADRAGGTETAWAVVEGFKITISTATASLPVLDVPISSHPINPGGGTAVLLVPLIPRAAATTFAGAIGAGELLDVTVEIKAYGAYGDGQDFETGDFKVEATLNNGGFADPRVTPGAVCRDPENPTYLGSCPQARQTSVVNCGPAPAAP